MHVLKRIVLIVMLMAFPIVLINAKANQILTAMAMA